MKKITKTNSLKFIKNMNKELLLIGANANNNNNTESSLINYHLMTKGGLLSIKVDTDNQFCYTVYTRFLDGIKARKENILAIDKPNDKWNFHITTNDPIKSVDEIINDLKKII